MGEALLPLGSSEPPPLALHTHPLRLIPTLEAGGARVPCTSVGVEGAHSHGPGGQALSPEVGSLEEGVCPPELLVNCESSKAWQELVF